MKKTYFAPAAATISLILAPMIWAAENSPTVDFGGRIQADATYYNNDKFDYSDGSEARRLRAAFQGNLVQNWNYKVEYDFAPDEPELKDGFFQYSGFTNTQITIGHFKVFPGLEELTSSNNITFTERALPNALVKNRRLALGYANWSERYTLQAAVYTHEANNLARGDGVSARFSYRPALQEGQLLHLGINLAQDTDDDDSIRLRERPESHQDDNRIIDTSSIAGIDDYSTIGLEASYVNRRFSAQAEYMRQDIDRRSGSDLSFDGYYAYVSYFLTNDSRPYSNSSAAFGTVSPSATSGAWEIAARISNLDLTDVEISGGEVDAFTLGVSYYMTSDLRFMANYIMADSNNLAGDDDPNILQLRLRFTF